MLMISMSGSGTGCKSASFTISMNQVMMRVFDKLPETSETRSRFNLLSRSLFSFRVSPDVNHHPRKTPMIAIAPPRETERAVSSSVKVVAQVSI